MTTLMLVLICIAGLYVGWNIGANDTANCIGTSVGAGLIRYRTAVIMVGICVVAGAILQGHHVMKTIGKGIVTDPISPDGVLAALICSGIFVSLATFLKVPVSTSQSIVGGVAGVGLAAQLNVNSSKILTIVECWIICPILTMVLAYAICRITRWTLGRFRNRTVPERILTFMVIGSAGYVAYSLGANDVGNAIGPIASLDIVDMKVLSLVGGIALCIGALTFGRGVTETVGRSITKLDLAGAFSAQISAAFGVHFFSMMGIPVSTSQAVVGGVLGIGVLRGVKTISRRKLVEIFAGWVLTPTCAGTVSFLVYAVVTRFQ